MSQAEREGYGAGAALLIVQRNSKRKWDLQERVLPKLCDWEGRVPGVPNFSLAEREGYGARGTLLIAWRYSDRNGGLWGELRTRPGAINKIER